MKTIKVLLLLTGLSISSMVFGASAPATVLTPEQKEKIEDNKLLAAAKSGVLKRAQTALRRGANIKATDKDGWIALDLAARNGHVAVVSLLLQSGADIKAINCHGLTALHVAARNGHVTVAKLLLDNKADINTRSNLGGTAFHHAARNGHVAVVKLLLENKADINARNRFGLTALRFANLGGYEAIVTLINNEPKKRTREYNRACRRAWCRGIRNLENLEKVVGKRRPHYDANGTEEELLKFFRFYPGLRKQIGGYILKFYNPASADEFQVTKLDRFLNEMPLNFNNIRRLLSNGR